MNTRKLLLPIAFAGVAAVVIAASISDAAASMSAARASAELVGIPQNRIIKIQLWPKIKSNEINKTKTKALEVAIIKEPTLDWTDIEPTSIEFAQTLPARSAHTNYDADRDGLDDRIYYFNTKDLKITAADTTACLTAKTLTGQTWRGCTTVKVIDK